MAVEWVDMQSIELLGRIFIPGWKIGAYAHFHTPHRSIPNSIFGSIQTFIDPASRDCHAPRLMNIRCHLQKSQ